MPNIYLKVSRYIAAFYRSKGDGQSRPRTEAIDFSPYTQEYVVICAGLRIVPEQSQHYASCYSQTAWRNMLRGALPQGGRPILKPKSEDYLSYAEVCTLEKLTNRTKSDAYDFLCIKAPRIINSHGKLVKVSNSHTLDTSSALQLRRLLRDNFVRNILDYEQRNIIFAKANGIQRTSVEILERFLMENDIPVSHDNVERDTLKRLLRRWRKEAGDSVRTLGIDNDGSITRIDKDEG